MRLRAPLAFATLTLPSPFHQGESRVNRRRLTSRQANVKQDKSRAHVKRTSSTHSSPPDHPATIQWLVKITQDPPVCTNTHQRGPSASLD
ncbi:hypothetical protein O181_075904, partial [Austropuccinia psidii MF-1]|nr:hypothetical protein [Austropuccinia psidii MF-1]